MTNNLFQTEKSSELLKGLNEQQKEAVLINEGSLLVFAGAGSGKTRVITTKIAYAIENKIVKPYQILAVTFTNKACREMKDRVTSMVGEELSSKTVIRTFHSLGAWILRVYGERLGIPAGFTIYDDTQTLSLLRQCYPEKNAEECKAAAHEIGLAKERGISIPAEYNKYEEALARSGNVDFGDLIVKSIRLLSENEDIREKVQNRFKYILVDEYQDTNPSQLALLKLLRSPDGFICVVGDDDQSIYKFRCADVKTILSFPKVFPGTKTVVLGKNYRCSKSILRVARDVIDHNKGRQVKDLQSANDEGEKPELRILPTAMDEAISVAEDILADKKYSYSETAILYRTNAQSNTFEDALRYRGIPYHVVGDVSFSRREEIQDSVAILRLILNPRDSVAFERLVSKTVAGVGKTTIATIIDASTATGSDLFDTLSALLSSQTIKGRGGAALTGFLNLYRNATKTVGTVSNKKFMQSLVLDFGIVALYKERDEKEKLKDSNRVENIRQLMLKFDFEDYANDLEGLVRFVEDYSLEPSDNPEEEEKGVTLMTMHRTKGLEFDRVYVTGLEQRIFNGRSFSLSKEDEEEERRLCYVAFTRARHRLVLTCAAQRSLFGSMYYDEPVSFVDEIESDHIIKNDKRGFQSRLKSKPFMPDVGSGRYYNDGYKTYSGYGGYNKRILNSAPSSSGYIKAGRDRYDDWTPPVSKPKVTLVKKNTEAKPSTGAIKFEVGERVKHAMLGPGTITAIKKFGTKDIVTVTFDSNKMGTYIKDKFDFEKLD
ncbi:MAG: ATP-dependent helicase [Sphaerochaetaceae bacterium]|nr:ATP-dependent helicase [Sphaerochaetaceae bacterium]